MTSTRALEQVSNCLKMISTSWLIPLSCTSPVSNQLTIGPEGATEDRLHRGRNVVLSFLMQGERLPRLLFFFPVVVLTSFLRFCPRMEAGARS